MRATVEYARKVSISGVPSLLSEHSSPTNVSAWTCIVWTMNDPSRSSFFARRMVDFHDDPEKALNTIRYTALADPLLEMQALQQQSKSTNTCRFLFQACSESRASSACPFQFHRKYRRRVMLSRCSWGLEVWWPVTLRTWHGGSVGSVTC